MERVRLLVLNAALGALDYKLAEGQVIQPGSVVVAPLGPRTVTGIVWDEGRLPGAEIDASKLRSIREVVPVPPLSQALRRLIEWTADYYCAPLASVARMVLSSGGALGGPSTTTEYRLSGGAPERMTPQRAAAIEALEGEQATIRELSAIAGVSEGVLRGLVNQGVIEPVTVAIDRPYPPADPDHHQPALSPDQLSVAKHLVKAVEARGFEPFLLDGVTGSGKTETYFEPIAEAVRMGRQVLVLLPEIALTENFPHPVRGSVRRGARPMALLAQINRTAPGVAGDFRRVRAGRGWRALGLVPALCRSGPDRRR